MEKKARATVVTDAKLGGLKLPEGKAELRVLVESGLYLHLRRRTDGGAAKHWQFRTQVGGVRKWLSLGEYPAVTLRAAKEEADKHRTVKEAAKKGEAEHPAIVARFARRSAIEAPTVAQAFDEWIADKRLGSKRKGGKPVRERTITILRENFDADIRDKLGEAKVGKLTRAHIKACIDAPRKRGAPGSAAHVYRTLRGLVNYAIAQDWITGADPMRGVDNPKPYRPAPPNAATDAELTALLRALDESAISASVKACIELQLLTGARPGEARLAQWSEMRLDRRHWVLPAERVKSDRAFTIHLSDAAVALLKRAKANKADKSDLIFPGAEGAELDKMAVSQALRRLAERVEDKGGKRLAPHDLRKTFRTMLARIGVLPHIAERCMNHAEKEALRAVYDGHDYTREVIAAWDAAGAHITALRQGGAQVIPIRAA